MLLVVVLHCSRIYSVSADWVASDRSNSIVFDLIGGTISAFAMPAFFLIAGFFSVSTLTRYRTTWFLKSRMMRLGIPLISTALTFNVLQVYVCVWHQYPNAVGILKFIRCDLPKMWVTVHGIRGVFAQWRQRRSHHMVVFSIERNKRQATPA